MWLGGILATMIFHAKHPPGTQDHQSPLIVVFGKFLIDELFRHFHSYRCERLNQRCQAARFLAAAPSGFEN